MSNSEKQSYKNFKFAGQRNGEEIKLIIRRHKIILLSYFLILLLMSLLPVIFYIVAVPMIFTAFFSYPYDRMYIFFTLIYYGFLWIIAFTIWVDYYLDVWIITDMRLLDIEQVGFFSRKVSELDLKRIQDITSEVNGMMGSMLSFGNVYIQTASEETRFKLKSIPHPVTTRNTIINLYEAARDRDRFIFRERDE
jgi:uncharacterized membrane protein YdbT with pleckstrin-like domain